jgi:hypothetical protein
MSRVLHMPASVQLYSEDIRIITMSAHLKKFEFKVSTQSGGPQQLGMCGNADLPPQDFRVLRASIVVIAR